MSDTVARIRDRFEKVQARVSRYEKLLETAKNELSDLQTTLRVLGEMDGESTYSVPSLPGIVTKRQLEIVELLGDGQANARPPVSLFTTYSLLGTEAINLDTFRTTIWRMNGRGFTVGDTRWIVRSENGQYWKERKEKPPE